MQQPDNAEIVAHAEEVVGEFRFATEELAALYDQALIYLRFQTTWIRISQYVNDQNQKIEKLSVATSEGLQSEKSKLCCFCFGI